MSDNKNLEDFPELSKWVDDNAEVMSNSLNMPREVISANEAAKKLMAANTIEHAMNVLTAEMKDVELGSYAHTWHCNIAMACYDAMLTAAGDAPYALDHLVAHKIANDAATRFMSNCFNARTKNEK